MLHSEFMGTIYYYYQLLNSLDIIKPQFCVYKKLFLVLLCKTFTKNNNLI